MKMCVRCFNWNFYVAVSWLEKMNKTAGIFFFCIEASDICWKLKVTPLRTDPRCSLRLYITLWHYWFGNDCRYYVCLVFGSLSGNRWTSHSECIFVSAILFLTWSSVNLLIRNCVQIWYSVLPVRPKCYYATYLFEVRIALFWDSLMFPRCHSLGTFFNLFCTFPLCLVFNVSFDTNYIT